MNGKDTEGPEGPEGPENVPAEAEVNQEVDELSRLLTNVIGWGLMMIPVGGFALWLGGNAALDGWLDVTPKMSYGEACGTMTLLWLIKVFMYPKRQTTRKKEA